jgi:hypothetical protein
MTATDAQDPSEAAIAAADALSDFMRELDEHITRRVHYDRDGPRYAGDTPPGSAELERALAIVIRATIRAALDPT